MVKDWYSENKDFFRNYSPLKVMEEVYEQASGHMERQTKSAILERQRPNEDNSVKDYRNDNKRNITHGDVDRWLTKQSRIIRDNVFSTFEGSDRLQEYQSNKVYTVFGEGYDYFEWIVEYILPGSIRDPNSIKINLPYIPSDPLMPPAFGVTQIDGAVPIKEVVIKFDKVFARDEVLAFEYGKKSVKVAENKSDHPVYWLADQVWWYILEPYWNGNTGAIDWELKEWYKHDSEQLPFVNAMGVYKGQYKESLIRSYFELADEFVGFFSDNQAIAVNHAYPKMVQIELPCPTCRTGSTSTGREKIGDEMIQCRTCKGSKTITAAGPFATLSIPADAAFGDTPIKPSDAIHPVVYGESLFKSRVEIGWDILDKARKSIGLDLLENLSESGIAKEYRLEDLQDMIGNVVKHMHQFMRSDLWLKECLLQPNKTLREIPVFDLPTTFYIQDEKAILMSIRDLPVTERQDKMIDYYAKKYKSDPVMEKVYEMSVIYAPTQLYTDEEVLQYASAGIFSKEQVVKGMYATWAMKQIGEPIVSMSITNIFAAADSIIEQFIDTIPVNVFA